MLLIFGQGYMGILRYTCVYRAESSLKISGDKRDKISRFQNRFSTMATRQADWARSKRREQHRDGFSVLDWEADVL